MELPLACCSAQAPARSRRSRRSRRSKLARCFAILCVGFVLGAHAIPASASTDIYFYDANDDPVDVTFFCLYHDNHVYDLAYNLVGYVDQDACIYDPSGLCIGFVAQRRGGSLR